MMEVGGVVVILAYAIWIAWTEYRINKLHGFLDQIVELLEEED